MTRAITAIERMDLSATRAVADGRFDSAVQRAGDASELADQPPLVALSAATLVAGLAMRSRPVARAGVRMLLAHGLATGIKTAIKRSVDRTRPDVALIDGYRMAAGNSDEHDLSSFPSGHTAGSVAVAAAVGREAEALAAPAYLLAAGVAIIQVPRCKHYVSDVVAGALIGALSALAANRLIEAADARWFSDS